MRPGEERITAMDRRAFLAWVPRRMFAGAQELATTVSSLTDRMSGETIPEGAGRLAVLDPSRCVAWGGGMCQACYLRCPRRDEAMVLDDGRPLIVASACDGCGVCVEACRTVNDVGAIRLVVEPGSLSTEASDNLHDTPSPAA